MIARIVAQKLSEKWGKPVIVEFQAFVNSEIQRWGSLVQKSGATAD
jgi:tripartite-type tricarboxylate transporter receptor subunit TctC